MKLITKNTDYCIRALLCLAREKGRFISSSTISVKEGIPLQFLRRILVRLVKAGLIVSKEGVDGGIKLNVPVDSICLDKIITIFGGKIQLADCLFRKKLCPKRSSCILRYEISKIEERLTREFKNLSIASLLRQMR
jgi:Rrf2 family protein